MGVGAGLAGGGGCLSRAGSLSGGVCPGGYLSGGVCVCLGVACPGGVCPVGGVCLSRVQGVPVGGGVCVCLAGVSVQAGCVPARGECVSQHTMGQTLPLWTDRHL